MLRARDLMHDDVLCVRSTDSVDSLLETLVGEHLHGAPVLDENDELVGVVSQQDIFFGAMTRNAPGGSPAGLQPLLVRDIMTSPAMSANEGTDLRSLCQMMWRLRIHRVPIVEDGRVTGIVSSLDVCAAISEGRLNTD